MRTGDRYSAAALLDRMLPGLIRKAVWSRFRPGIPGPFTPVYEKAVSDEGIAAYALMRGLVIAARGSELTRPDRPAGLSSSVRITCAAISRLSGGRFADSHDELLYVIRKPLDRFARVVLARLPPTRAGGLSSSMRISGAPRARGGAARDRQLPAELANWPAWTPGEEQLGELELITSGAFAPLRGYLGRADLAAVAERGELADGTPWPVPVTLTVPAAAVPAGASQLVLQDPEGSPLAVVEITERVPAADGAALRLAGPVTALRPPEHGPFRALRAAPAEVRAELGAGHGPVLALATRRPLGQRQIGQLGTSPTSCARHDPAAATGRRARPTWSPGRRRWSAPSSPPPGSSRRAR